MKKLTPVVIATSISLFIFAGCVTKQTQTENSQSEQAMNDQVSLLQTSLENLVKSIDSNAITKNINPGSQVEKEKKAESALYRLKVIQESINNLSKVVSTKSLTVTGCHWEVVGYYSCNCKPNPNGTIHCDLCPIYKWVCN